MKTQTQLMKEAFIEENPKQNRQLYEEAKEELEFAWKLKKARIDKCIDQKMLAQKSGIRQSEISRIETGTISPTLKTITKYLKALDLTLDFKPQNHQ